MMTEIKQIISQRIIEIKMFIICSLTSFSSWYASNYSEIVTVITEIATCAAFTVLFIYNLLNTKKIELDLKLKQRQWDEANKK